MLDRQKEDAEFQKKWLTYSYTPITNASYHTWKKFLKETPRRLDEDCYQEIAAKLWKEDFQIPPIESPVHDNPAFSREMDTREEIAYLERNEDRTLKQPALTQAALREELVPWIPRNLTIFFIEYLIDSEINIQTYAKQNSVAPQKNLDDRISKIRIAYEHILETINAAEYYASQPEHYIPTNNPHSDLFDIEKESETFSHLIQRLSILLNAKQFELLKLHLTIATHGIELPNNEELIRISNMKDADCISEINAINALRASTEDDTPPEKPGSLRRSRRVLSGLCDHDEVPASAASPPTPDSSQNASGDQHSPAPPAPDTSLAQIKALPKNISVWKAPSKKQILAGIAIVAGVALVVTGLVLAAVFSGGTVALALAVGLAALTIVGGIMTCCQKASRRGAQEVIQNEPEAAHVERDGGKRTNNADLQQKLGGLTKGSHAPDKSRASYPSLPETTLLPQSASPPAQNQETTIASIPNANRH